MSITSLFLYVFFGTAICFLYFHLSNLALDFASKKNTKKFSQKSVLRPYIFIAPAVIILVIFILYPVVETLRLSFFNKTGFEFVGIKNYVWAANDPEFKRAILNNLGWLLVVPTLSAFFGLVIAYLADKLWWGTIAKSIIYDLDSNRSCYGYF